MRQRIWFLVRFYAACLLLFAVAKPLFMLFNGAEERGLTFSDYWQVPAHGVPLDIATTGYLAIIPWLGLLLSIFVKIPHARRLWNLYSGVVAALLAFILVGDACLYSFWEFKVDSTVFVYMDSPEGVTQSVSSLYLLLFVTTTLIVAVVFYVILARLVYVPVGSVRRTPLTLILSVLCHLLIGGLIFLGIRGGIGRSTANVGMVYYSENQFLNHSAVNPPFSLFSSIGKNGDFASEADYFQEDMRADLFESLQFNTESRLVDTLLTTQRPNVLIVLMEGLAGQFVEAVGGMPDVTPHLNALAKEGVVFTNCYANSYRTDRGTVCTLSGYPGFPSVSVMKVAAKSRKLPGIARTLRYHGYATDFLYGGDVNFTNMKSYLLATGYERAYGDADFPLSVRRTHAWGVTDSIAFDRLFEMVAARDTSSLWHTTFLTLASHEPWEVPYARYSDEIVNSMAYVDACIGRFMTRLRALPQWKNTLVVFIPDHGIVYPKGITEAEPKKYHIPMIWAGGTVRQHREIATLCNQTDLAATLLGQMGLAHKDFVFSRDVLSATYAYPCAFHTWSEGVSFIDSTGMSALNLTTDQPLAESPSPSSSRIRAAKAYLQTIYDDLGGR